MQITDAEDDSDAESPPDSHASTPATEAPEEPTATSEAAASAVSDDIVEEHDCDVARCF